MRSMFRLALIAWAFAGPTGVAAEEDASSLLASSRARWEAAALADYEYGYHKYCDCYRDSPPETLVTVRGGTVERVRHRRAGFADEVPAEDRNVHYYWTVAELFALLRSALDRDATVRAEYDAALGFPTLIYIDYDANMIGDELDLRLTRVTPLDR